MPNDYRALHNQYAQGMSQQGTVQPNSAPGFNFLQGWSASPTAGYMPPKGPTQAPIQYGTPTQGGWIGGPDGQPVGGGGQNNSWMNNGQDPRAMQYDGIKGNWAAWRAAQSSGTGDPRAMLSDGNKTNFRDWAAAYQRGGQQSPLGGNMQANYGMTQPLIPSFGATPMPKPDVGIQQPIPMPKPIVGLNPIQYDQFGKPIPVDQLNPGRDPNIWGGP